MPPGFSLPEDGHGQEERANVKARRQQGVQDSQEPQVQQGREERCRVCPHSAAEPQEEVADAARRAACGLSQSRGARAGDGQADHGDGRRIGLAMAGASMVRLGCAAMAPRGRKGLFALPAGNSVETPIDASAQTPQNSEDSHKPGCWIDQPGDRPPKRLKRCGTAAIQALWTRPRWVGCAPLLVPSRSGRTSSEPSPPARTALSRRA